MIDISKPLTTGKAKTYYQQEYSVASNNYLSQGQTLSGHVRGPLAEVLGLSSEIKPEQFERLMEGRHPITGEQLIRHKDTVKTRDGRELGHRAGWDVTINASKSVSVTTLVGGDEELRQAHLRAERKAIEWGTQFIQARTGASAPAETTAKAVWISFEHTTARPVDGYSAPQLHGHNILVNLTQDSAGKWRSLQTAELFRIQKGMRAVYHSEMGHYLLSRGFEIERGKNHSVEIKGYSKEYLEAESPRSRQIREAVDKWERENGRKVDREIRQQLAHEIRDEKAQLAPERQHDAWRANAERFGNEPDRMIQQAARQHERTFSEHEIQRKTEAAVSHAIASLSEREAVFEHWKVVELALDHNLTTNLDRVEAEIKSRQQRGELIRVDHVRPNAPLHRFTTPEMLAIEREVIERVLTAQNQPEMTAPILEQHLRRYPELNTDQIGVLREALLSHDQVFGIQGKPGTGKSYPLASIKELVEEHGYRVRGLGPTSQATKGLRQAGIDSETLQMHLTRPQSSDRPTLYLLDESSLASGKQMRDFLRTLEPRDRALLIGDIGQHQSVEAGRIFAELQDAGMRVAKLDKILRQKDEGLRLAVEAATDGRIDEALRLLKEQGRIHEIPQRDERLKTMVRDYAVGQGSGLLLSHDNFTRQDLNAATRAELRRTERLKGDTRETGILITRQDVTGADRERAVSYQPGDTIRYRKGSKRLGIKPKSYAEVIAVDPERNLLIVRQGERYQTYDPSTVKGVSVYEPAKRSFSVGDRIQFLQKWDDHSISTRDLATITDIDRHGNVKATLEDSGRTVKWNISQYRHIDHAYAMTSYSAQGATVDHSFIHIDTSSGIDQTTLKVALSRARFDAHIYTDNTDRLLAAVSRTNDNTQALSPEQVAQYRQPERVRAERIPMQQSQDLNYGHAIEF
ncbi:MAG: relaxase domain-containing protein [Acidobacteriaceae bacterium]|nr:relaxase domain-containing protein [Acidobacteriaceae bacterium]